MRVFSYPSAILALFIVLASLTYAQDSSSSQSASQSASPSESQAQSSGSSSDTASVTASASGASSASGNATTVAPSRTTIVTYSVSPRDHDALGGSRIANCFHRLAVIGNTKCHRIIHHRGERKPCLTTDVDSKPDEKSAHQVTASAASSSKTSTSQTPLKTLSETLAGGNAGSDNTVTAPDPGSTGARSKQLAPEWIWQLGG